MGVRETGGRGRSCRIFFATVLASLALFTVFPTARTLAVTVKFNQDVYIVTPSMPSFDVGVVIDGDDIAPGLQPVTNGLFSYGWQFTFDQTKATVDNIAVVPDLNFFDFNPGAQTSIGPGLGGARGNIDLSGPAYGGTSLATVSMTNLATAPDSYLLTLAIDPIFPTEQVYVDGAGNVLDPQMLFGTALVIIRDDNGGPGDNVIPEPSVGAAMGLWIVSLLGCRRRRARN